MAQFKHLTHEDYLDIKAGSEDGNFTLAWAKTHIPALLVYIDALKEALLQGQAKSEERRALLAAVQWHTALGADESRCVGCGEWASMGCTTDCRFYYALADDVSEHEHRWVATMETYVDFEHGGYYFKLADSNTWRRTGGWDSPIPANVFCADCRITADQVKITMSL